MKTQITKLFAVAALTMGGGIAAADAPRATAKGRPACGNVMTKSGPRPRDCGIQTAVEATPTPVAPVAKKPVAVAIKQQAAKLMPAVAIKTRVITPAVVATPRVNKEGRPAPGNVMTKK